MVEGTQLVQIVVNQAHGYLPLNSPQINYIENMFGPIENL